MGALKLEQLERSALSKSRTVKISDKAGKVKCKQLFNYAVSLANNGEVLKSIEVAHDALIYAKFSKSYDFVYINSLLALLNYELGKLKVAEYHVVSAIRSLNRTHIQFKEDGEYLNSLLTSIQNQIKSN